MSKNKISNGVKIAIPTDGKNGLEDTIAEHFGRAKSFLVYDMETKTSNVYPNPEATGGSQLPPDFLRTKKVSVVIVFSLGPMAYNKFEDYHIKMSKAIPGSIFENIKEFKKNNLGELAKEDIF